MALHVLEKPLASGGPKPEHFATSAAATRRPLGIVARSVETLRHRVA